jgi:hypothetical protein
MANNCRVSALHRRAAFDLILAGAGVPGVAPNARCGVVAPTLAYLLGLPMPATVEGGIIYEALEDPNWPLTALGQ